MPSKPEERRANAPHQHHVVSSVVIPSYVEADRDRAETERLAMPLIGLLAGDPSPSRSALAKKQNGA